MSIIDQINSATAKELAGYSPMTDKLNRSVLELLDTLDELIDGIEQCPEDHEQAIQLQCIVSMIRVKLGFPASVHTSFPANREIN